MTARPSATTSSVDFCVIGGGIVGLATARALLEKHPDATVALLEKENSLARHQTGHNSGVIHSGIYYAPGSLKAEFAIEGSAATKEFCRENDIPVEVCGKYLVATNDLEVERLKALEERAAIHHLAAEKISGAELRRREPNVTGLEALFIPSTGIVDYTLVSFAIARGIQRAGATIHLGSRVISIVETDGGVIVETPRMKIRAGHLVVCAGLQADRMARLARVKTAVQIVPFRGEYFRLSPARAKFVGRLIYPVPDPALPFLGIHISPTIGGDITLGPSAVLGLSREGYPKFAVNPKDMLEYAAFPGLWRVAASNLGTAVREVRNSLLKSSYLKEAQKYAPTLRSRDMLPYRAGIRAQAVHRDGTLLSDFLIERTGHMTHVLNAPSPAATAAFPIGRFIADQV